MNTFITWFQKNKVLIFGLLAAIAMTVDQYLHAGPVQYPVLALAALIAGIGFLAKNLRGQWATILASLVPSLGVILTDTQSHIPISWAQIITSAAIAIAGIFSPPAKPASYEKDPVIEKAKNGGNTPPPPQPTLQGTPTNSPTK